VEGDLLVFNTSLSNILVCTNFINQA